MCKSLYQKGDLICVQNTENETYKYASRMNNKIGDKSPLEECITMLKETPLTNHAVLEIARPSDIIKCISADGKKDPPCLRLIDFKVIPIECQHNEMCLSFDNCKLGLPCKNGYIFTLTVSVYFRSWDLWGGLPVNLGGIELLKQYVCQETGLKNGPMYAYSAGLHVYGIYKDIVAIRTMKDGKKNDTKDKKNSQ